MIELRLFGTVQLRRGGDGRRGGSVESVAVQPKRLALLGYLAAATPRGPHRRDTLLGLLWPELDADRGRAALSKALHHLRMALGADAIVSHGEEAVELVGGGVECDVVGFEEALEAGRLEDALDVYAGDLLHGFFVSDAPEFERWLDAERARLRSRAAAAAASLAERCEAAGDPAAGVSWARRALELNAGSEPALRHLMTLLDASGDRAGALLVFDAFAAAIRAELEVEPAPETRALADAIRERRPAPHSPQSPVTENSPPSVTPPATSPPASPPLATSPPASPSPAAARRPRAPRARRRRTVIAAVAVLGLGLVGAVAYRAMPRAGAVLEPRRVLVLPFDNRTLDPALEPVGRMAADWIIEGVARTGEYEVVPVTAVWAAQGGATDARTYDGRAVRAVAQETGAGTVLSGSYYREGGRLFLQARTHDAATGRLLHAVATVSTALDSVVEGIDQLRTRILADLAVAGDTIYHVRVATPPPSFEAYREYIAGMESFVAGSNPALALRHYERAAAADSTYAMPRIAAAIMHMNLGDMVAADSIIAPLDAVREQLGPLERNTVDMVLGLLQGSQTSVYEASLRLARIAPGTINEYMVAEMARRLNRPAEAVTVLEHMGAERGELRGWRPYWRELAWSHHMLGDHDRELAAARRARALYPHSPMILSFEVRALAALGRIADLRQRIDERTASADPAAPSAGELLSIAARELAAHGHAAAAGEMAARAVAWYESRPSTQRAGGTHRRQYARALMELGRHREAADVLDALQRENPSNALHTALLGLAHARLGDRASAISWSAEAGAAAPIEGRAGRLNPLAGDHTFIRATTAAALGDADRAVELLRQAEYDGLRFSPDVLCSPDLAPLRDHPSFEAWRQPRTLPGSR
jgi:DNA-binding SARP family transcriptional activator/tetratricopeptide (TPR) repeat protein/TolB-like protein